MRRLAALDEAAMGPLPRLEPVQAAHAPLLLPAGVEAFGELAEGFGFDLADSLAGEAEGFADLFESAWLLVVEAETHSQHGRLAGVHGLEHRQRVAQIVVG